jgi:hypothetical protein
MKRLARGTVTSPRKACRALSRTTRRGARAPFRRCVAAGAKLKADLARKTGA